MKTLLSVDWGLDKYERRAWSMVRRLAATPQLLNTYGNIITEQEACDFIEKVDDARPTDNAHYRIYPCISRPFTA